MSRTFFVIGALSALLAVAAGAFGAHGLRGVLEPRWLETFETGARYQMVHALALLVLAVAAGRSPGGLWAASGWLFVAGTVLFSGSLYILSLTGARWLGAITPLGGLCFLAGWACAAAAALRSATGAP